MNEFVARNGLIALDSSSISGPLTVSGNVGINTSSPTARLDVRGNISSSGNFTIGGNIYKSVDNDNLGLYGGPTNSVLNGFIKINGQNNNWGRVQINIGYEPTNSKGVWTLNDSTELMTLTGRGNLGIGTPSPITTLDVRGGTYISSSTGVLLRADGLGLQNILFVSSSGNIGINTNSLLYGSAGNSAGRLTINNSSGNNGLVIRNADDGYALSIKTTTNDSIGVQFTWYNGATQTFLQHTGTVTRIGTNAAGYSSTVYDPSAIQFLFGTSEVARLTSGGNLGLGITTPAAKLDVRGTTFLSGSVGVLTSSPTTTLHVNGNGRFNNTVSSNGGALFTANVPSNWPFSLEAGVNQAIVANANTNTVTFPIIASYGNVAIIGANAASTGGRTNIGVFGYTYFTQTMSGNASNQANAGYFLALGRGNTTDFIGTYRGIYSEANIGTDTALGGSVIGGTFVAVGAPSQSAFGLSAGASGATNNYGIHTNMSSATNTWALFMGGSATSYFAGNVGIGITTPTHPLTVANSVRFGAVNVHLDGCTGCANYFRISHDNSSGTIETLGASGGRHIILKTSGNVGNIGINTTSPTYKLDIDGSFRASGSITATSGSDYFDISHDITQPAQTSSQVYEVNITPTLRYTAPNQTQTALRVAATFTGSTALSSSQSNIIADFGSTSAGSQLVINDTTSGSIYMVNDVSGLPIIEANSNWDVFIYDYPNVVLKKTGSTIEVSGSLRLNGSSLDTAWTSYTPQWTAPVTNPVLNNGTITGAYKLIGKTCFVRVRLVIGSTTTLGSGQWYFSLPFSASIASGIQFPCSILDNGNAWYQGIVNGEYGGFTDRTAIIGQSSGSNSSQGISEIFPIAWGTSDSLQFNGSYEIA